MLYVHTVRLGIFQNSQRTQSSKAQSSLASVMAFTYVFNCSLVTKATSDSKICCQATAGQTSALGIRAPHMHLLHCPFRKKEQAIPRFLKVPINERKKLSFTVMDNHQMMNLNICCKTTNSYSDVDLSSPCSRSGLQVAPFGHCLQEERHA